MGCSSVKGLYGVFFLLGVTVMLAFTKLGASNSETPHHVYELRLYHAKEGKMDALKSRFDDHTDAIFRRHNMKSIEYRTPENAPPSQNPFLYILATPSRQ